MKIYVTTELRDFEDSFKDDDAYRSMLTEVVLKSDYEKAIEESEQALERQYKMIKSLSKLVQKNSENNGQVLGIIISMMITKDYTKLKDCYYLLMRNQTKD